MGEFFIWGKYLSTASFNCFVKHRETLLGNTDKIVIDRLEGKVR